MCCRVMSRSILVGLVYPVYLVYSVYSVCSVRLV